MLEAEAKVVVAALVAAEKAVGKAVAKAAEMVEAETAEEVEVAPKRNFLLVHNHNSWD